MYAMTENNPKTPQPPPPGNQNTLSSATPVEKNHAYAPAVFQSPFFDGFEIKKRESRSTLRTMLLRDGRHTKIKVLLLPQPAQVVPKDVRVAVVEHCVRREPVHRRGRNNVNGRATMFKRARLPFAGKQRDHRDVPGKLGLSIAA